MRWRRRELPAVALATGLAAALAVTGCHGSSPRPVASSSPSASVSPPSPYLRPRASPVASPPAGRTFVYGVLGDYGVDGPAVRAVVAEMRRFAPRLDAVVTTGDNGYCCGTRAQETFARNVLAPLRAPVYPALGNHDDATSGGGPFLATFGLAGRWYHRVVGPVEFVVLDANHPNDRAQRIWLDALLDRPRAAAFRVVVFHQPGWSCSFHDPQRDVMRLWLPRFRGTVDLVLAGHNHTYERFAGPGGIPYVTTGGGGAGLYASVPGTCRGAGHVVTFKTVHHALRLTATRTALTVEAFATDGTSFDRFVVRAR